MILCSSNLVNCFQACELIVFSLLHSSKIFELKDACQNTSIEFTVLNHAPLCYVMSAK